MRKIKVGKVCRMGRMGRMGKMRSNDSGVKPRAAPSLLLF